MLRIEVPPLMPVSAPPLQFRTALGPSVSVFVAPALSTLSAPLEKFAVLLIVMLPTFIVAPTRLKLPATTLPSAKVCVPLEKLSALPTILVVPV